MNIRKLGKSGIAVSEVGLGCWQLGGDFGPVEEERAQAILRAADESGVRFWDTADVYGDGLSESRIGRYRSANHPDVIVATKVGRGGELYPDGYSKDKVKAGIQRSARRIGVDALDLVQLHCVPPDVLAAGDILAWLEDFQAEGLIRSFGASVETIEEALMVVRHPRITALQIIFNIFRQNAISRLFPAAQANNVGIIVRLPLASGVLSGKMTADQSFQPSDHRHFNRDGAYFSQGETFSGLPFEKAVGLVDNIKAWVPEGMSMAQMAMRWILDQPAVSSVITGASRPEQVIENARTSELEALPQSLHERLADFYSRRVEGEIVVKI